MKINLESVLFFKRMTQRGKDLYFAALSLEAMKPLDTAESFTSGSAVTLQEILQLEPVIMHTLLLGLPEALEQASGKPILIPTELQSRPFAENVKKVERLLGHSLDDDQFSRRYALERASSE